MLHWYMTNAEYRIFEPPELNLELQMANEDDFSDNEQNENTSIAAGSIIGTIAGGLTRSLSAASKRGRSKSLRARPGKLNNNHHESNNLSQSETNNLIKIANEPATKKETVYLN